MAGKQLVDQFGHALVGPTITSTYKPVDMRYFTAVRDLPPLSLSTIEVMRKDSMVKLCLGILAAPLFKMELAYKEGDDWKPGVLAESPIVAEFVQRQFNTIWKWASHLCSAQVYGWCAAEVVLKYGDSDLIEVDSLVPRHARDVKALVQNGEVMGVQFERLNGGLNGIEKVGFPRCIWHIHAPQPGMFYGTSVLEGAYSPWWDKWMRGGAYDVRRLFMFKDAYGGMDMTYPVKDYDMGNGVVLHAKDIARQVVEQSQSGSVTTRPYDPDANGKNQWELERTSMPGNPQHILEYPDKCDREIQHGMGINDDVITADSSGSWNGKGLAMFALMITRDEWGALMLSDVVCQVIRQLVDINFGPNTYFEATHKPFAEQLKDQLGESPSQQGGGMMQNRFGGQMADPSQFSQDDEPGADLEPEQALRMSYAAIGRGVVEARKFVDGAKVIAMAAVHAPKGGVSVQGKEYKGGEFIPGEVMAKASPEEKKAVERDDEDNKTIAHLASQIKSGAMSKSQAAKQLKKDGKGHLGTALSDAIGRPEKSDFKPSEEALKAAEELEKSQPVESDSTEEESPDVEDKKTAEEVSHDLSSAAKVMSEYAARFNDRNAKIMAEVATQHSLLHDSLLKAGFEFDTISKSGSTYYRKGDRRIRISDHEVPETEERKHNSASGGFSWATDGETIVLPVDDIGEAISNVDDKPSEINAWAKEKFGDDSKADSFTKWFGDSQITERSGMPLAVFHGSGKEIDKFSETGKGEWFSFTPEISHAMEFGKNIHRAYLSVKNPLDLTSLGAGQEEWDGKGKDSRVSPGAVEEILRSSGINVSLGTKPGFTSEILNRSAKEIRKQALEAGIDGLIVTDFKEMDAQEFIVFSSASIYQDGILGTRKIDIIWGDGTRGDIEISAFNDNDALDRARIEYEDEDMKLDR